VIPLRWECDLSCLTPPPHLWPGFCSTQEDM
jgi:hypothetical protein